jgi:hypothetical protein
MGGVECWLDPKFFSRDYEYPPWECSLHFNAATFRRTFETEDEDRQLNASVGASVVERLFDVLFSPSVYPTL